MTRLDYLRLREAERRAAKNVGRESFLPLSGAPGPDDPDAGTPTNRDAGVCTSGQESRQGG